MKNVYRVYDQCTGRTYHGTADELEKEGLNGYYLQAAATRKVKIFGLDVEIIDKITTQKEKPKKKKSTMKDLEKLSIKANKMGLSYGQYVAMVEKGLNNGKSAEVLVLDS